MIEFRNAVCAAAVLLATVPAWAEEESLEAVLTPVGDIGMIDQAEQPKKIIKEIQGLETSADAHVLCDDFIRNIIEGKFTEAFEGIRPFFPVPGSRIEKLEAQTRKQLSMAELQFGPALGFRFVRADSLQDSILRFQFIQTYVRDAIYWEFIFYKPEEKWVVNALGFDDDLQKLYD